MPLVIDLRAAARKNKNFAVADKIRDGLGPIGITLEDRAGGTEWTGGERQAMRLRRHHEAPDPTPRRLPAPPKTSPPPTPSATASPTVGITLEDRAGGTEWTKS